MHASQISAVPTVIRSRFRSATDDPPRPLETPPPNLAYAFKHVTTQEVAYDLMLQAQRQALHRVIAEWLEPTGDLRNLARANIEIGTSRFMIGHAGEGAVDLTLATELARQAGDTALEREAANARLRLIAWGPTPASEGLEFCTALLENEATNAAVA